MKIHLYLAWSSDMQIQICTNEYGNTRIAHWGSEFNMCYDSQQNKSFYQMSNTVLILYYVQENVQVTLHSLKIMERYEDILQLKIHPLYFIDFINY